ncbi:MAG: class I SAM-dependent methyltransferase [Deltaproteobacteria bacterium]
MEVKGMEAGQYSQTALRAACYRAYHVLHDEPLIFDDILAPSFLTSGEIARHESDMVAGFRAAAPDYAASFPNNDAILAFMMQAMAAPALTLSRARYAEDWLTEAIQGGVGQYVILGAGLDTFAFRHPELLENIKVFEIDHPDTQAFKRERLKGLQWNYPSGLEMVPLDFNQGSLAQALTASSYDPLQPACFSWLGVSYYLSRSTILDTLSSIAGLAAAGSSILFDYLDADAFDPGKAAQRVQVLLMMARGVGETMLAGFEPGDLAGEVARLGLTVKEDLAPADIQARYFAARQDKYYACEHAHLVCLIKKD